MSPVKTISAQKLRKKIQQCFSFMLKHIFLTACLYWHNSYHYCRTKSSKATTKTGWNVL